LPLLGLWGAKHETVWTLYNGCKTYGWPKVYGRLLEQNKALNTANPAMQRKIQELVHLAIHRNCAFVTEKSGGTGGIEFAAISRRHSRVHFELSKTRQIDAMQDLVGAAGKKKKQWTNVSSQSILSCRHDDQEDIGDTI
jgi:hypothetical protein